MRRICAGCGYGPELAIHDAGGKDMTTARRLHAYGKDICDGRCSPETCPYQQQHPFIASRGELIDTLNGTTRLRLAAKGLAEELRNVMPLCGVDCESGQDEDVPDYHTPMCRNPRAALAAYEKAVSE